MKKFVIVVLMSYLIVVVLGLVIYDRLYRREDIVACELEGMYVIDYSSVFLNLEKHREQAQAILSSKIRVEELEPEASKYFSSKLDLLEKYEPFLKKFIKLHGYSFGCVFPQKEHLFTSFSLPQVYDIELSNDYQRDKDTEHDIKVSWLLSIIVGPIVPTIIAILSLFIFVRKKN